MSEPQPHRVTLENDAGWQYWACHNCDWHTRPTMYPNFWDGQAAKRHAAGDDREGDP